jgi:hypothetical protein
MAPAVGTSDRGADNGPVTGEITVVHARERPPDDWDAAVFLAGPTPRSAGVPSWRPEAIELLRRRWTVSGRLVVFVPEARDGAYADYLHQVDWEEQALHASDVVLFWIPRDLDTLPGFTTNVEWGVWHDSGRVVFGAPPGAPKNRYLLHYAGKCEVPTATTLAETVDTALAEVGSGARRNGGEREVPLLVWRTDSFQRWYAAQRAAGNTLRGARVVWTFRVGPAYRLVHYWALHVRLHVAAEDRVKDNEVVISRPDTVAVALYRRAATLDDTIVVLVREFRSPASTRDGFVHELPGGASPGAGAGTAGPAAQAVAEVEEETGLVIDAGRLRAHGSRQLAATLSAHHAHLFTAEITDAELERLRRAQGVPHGVAADSERTWVEITTYGEVRAGAAVDWATLGMLTQAVLAAGSRPETDAP